MEKIFSTLKKSEWTEFISGMFGRLCYACMGIMFYYLYSTYTKNGNILTLVADMYWVIVCGLGFALAAFLLNGTIFIEKKNMIKPYVVSTICWIGLYGWFAYWLAGQC